MDGFFVCATTLGFFVLLFGFILAFRYLNYRETLALAEKGLMRPPRQSNGSRTALVWGIIIGAIGLALTFGLWPLGFIGVGPTNYPLGFGPWMLVGLVPLFFGLALILIHVLTRKDAPAAEPPEAEPSAQIFPLSEDHEVG